MELSEGHELGLKSMASSHVPIFNGFEKSKNEFPPMPNPSRGSILGLKSGWSPGACELVLIAELDVWAVWLRAAWGLFQLQSRLSRSQ
jgi:hypothetical protein